MIAKSISLTAEDLLDRPDDGQRCELVKGELRTMPPGGGEHGFIGGRVIGRLFGFVEAHQLGEVFNSETGFLLARDPDTVRAPDAAFMTRARLKISPITKKYFDGPPDLAVEVASPNDTYTEVSEKVEEWLDGGTPYVIVIDPKRQVLTLFRAQQPLRAYRASDTLELPDILPGWSLKVGDLFPAKAE
jgi:Uma2 family endonuclease